MNPITELLHYCIAQKQNNRSVISVDYVIHQIRLAENESLNAHNSKVAIIPLVDTETYENPIVTPSK